jgi:RNA polymerase sigma-70 factor (ECF subfamily)
VPIATTIGLVVRSAAVDAVPARDESFGELLERHRRALQVHCYRMVGSFEDSEDLVQETLLRAWRARERFSFQGDAASRGWLYRIATNACLDFLSARPQRTASGPANAAEVPWLQPYPDSLLEPGAAVVAKETIELVFLVAVQHLPPRQRAVLMLRDLLGWSAKDAAALLDTTVVSVNSALQRARATVKQQLPERRHQWRPGADPTEAERELLQRLIDAHERADPDALAALLAEHARIVMPPLPTWWDGRDAIVRAMAEGPFQPEWGRFRVLPTRANGQPAIACYRRPPGAEAFLPLGIDVLRIEHGLVVEMLCFSAAPLGPQFSEAPVPDLFPAYGLPPALR